MKKKNKNCFVQCTFGRNKTYAATKDEKKPDRAICPACGNYHPVKKES